MSTVVHVSQRARQVGGVRIHNQQDAVVGVLYLLIGLGVSVVSALHYELGSAARMGPGYFPCLLGGILALLGLTILARSVRRTAPRTVLEPWDWRTLVWMIGALVLFGVALRPLGFALALILLVVVASLASHEFTWKGTLANAAVLVALNIATFVGLLSLPFNVWPGFLLAD